MRFMMLCLIFLCACTRDEPSGAEGSPTEAELGADTATLDPTPATEEAAVDEAILEMPPSFELLETGKPPMKALRRGLQEGSVHTIRMESEWSLDAMVFPAQTYAVMPGLDYELEVTVTKVSEDGAAHCDLRVARVKVKPSRATKPTPMAVLKAAAGMMAGITGQFVIDPHGVIATLDITAPPNASVRVHDMIDQIARALRLASLPLPEEPIGRGAKWEATQVVEHRGARVRQSATYELLSNARSQVRARVTFEQAAPRQLFTPPGAQNGLELNELFFEGDGRGTWVPGKLAPLTATETTETVLNTTTRGRDAAFVIVSTAATLEVH